MQITDINAHIRRVTCAGAMELSFIFNAVGWKRLESPWSLKLFEVFQRKNDSQNLPKQTSSGYDVDFKAINEAWKPLNVH